MCDPTKFQYLYEYYAFNVSLLSLVVSEIVIYVYTNFRHQNGNSLRRDFGTKWLLYINFVLCIKVSFLCVSHRAYTGSICSLIGISLALRNIIAVVIVLICCLISYSIRIYVEEKALQVNFGEYQSYKEHTYKMFPYIY